MSDVVIIDSGGANLASLEFALARLGASSIVTGEVEAVRSAPRVILPGVGAANDAMTRLRERGLDRLIPTLGQPLLGICLGMQLLFERSEEGETETLGVLPGEVRRLLPSRERPVPHMGWNTLAPRGAHPLLAGFGATDYVYFVHSFAAPVSEATLAVTEYGETFSAVVGRDNFFGAQFHPERSGACGARLLQNFLGLR